MSIYIGKIYQTFLTREIVLRLPHNLIRERYFTAKKNRSPFVQRATLFQDLVIRVVRYAFSDIPAAVGKVFFSKWVALPFIKIRMLRHGIWKSPIYWREVNEVQLTSPFDRPNTS